MIRSFYRMEEWKCPHCRCMLASGLWGPIENVKIDPSLWPPGTFQNLDAFVQRRLTLTDHELFHLMQTWDEEEERDRALKIKNDMLNVDWWLCVI